MHYRRARPTNGQLGERLVDSAIWTMAVAAGSDVALVRQRTRVIADRLGFDHSTQIALATAAGAAARGTVDRGGGRAVFTLRQTAGRSEVEIALVDDVPTTELVAGLGGARHLVDQAMIETLAHGATVTRLVKQLPERAPELDALAVEAMITALETAAPLDPATELELQDRGLALGLETLQAAHELATERLSRVGALTARMQETLGREFRTPLNTIQTLARMLLDRADGDLTPNQEKQVSFMLVAAESASDLVDELLELGRIDAGEPAPPQARRPRSDAIPPSDARRPLLIVEDRPEDFRLYEELLRGSDYPILGVRNPAEAEAVMAACQPCAVLLDLVRIDDAARAFLAQHRAAPHRQAIPVVVATADDPALAEAAGADVAAGKPVERGWLLETLGRLSPKPAAAALGARRILIIDDDETWRFTLRQFLPPDLGIVAEAATGEDGLRQLLTDPPDVAFVDLTMPGLSGFDVIRAAAADERTKDVPIVVVTSNLLNSTERASLSTAVAILRKDGMSRGSVAAALDQALGPGPNRP